MAMTAGDRLFVDSNVWVYARANLAPLHAVARSRLDDFDTAGADIWLSRQVLREYLATMTRPGLFTGKIPIDDLVDDVRQMEADFPIAEDGPAVTAELFSLLANIRCGGKQVHDANIVATMLVHRLPAVLTHNVADFQRFSHLVTVIPLVPPAVPGVP